MGNSCTNSEILFAIVSVPFVIFTGASFLINAATADEGGKIFLKGKKTTENKNKISFSVIIAIPATLISLGSLVFFVSAMFGCSRVSKF